MARPTVKVNRPQAAGDSVYVTIVGDNGDVMTIGAKNGPRGLATSADGKHGPGSQLTHELLGDLAPSTHAEKSSAGPTG